MKLSLHETLTRPSSFRVYLLSSFFPSLVQSDGWTVFSSVCSRSSALLSVPFSLLLVSKTNSEITISVRCCFAAWLRTEERPSRPDLVR